MGQVSRRSKGAALLTVLLSCCTVAGVAQSSLQQALLRSPSVTESTAAAPAPSTSVAAALQQLAGQASVIFTGSITTVTPDVSGGAEVKFAVEQGIRGASSGAGYTMHISAWAAGAERYDVGERALFLLTAPSASGYSAPVMGERGIVPLSGDALAGNLDLRWVAADVQRGSQPQDQSGTATARMRSAAVMVGVSPVSAGSTPSQDDTTATSSGFSVLPDVHAIDRDLILDLLRAGTSAVEQVR